MGWCGGTQIFDGALDVFLRYLPEGDRAAAVERWYVVGFAMEDWDCQSESRYYKEYLAKIMFDRDEIDEEDYNLSQGEDDELY